MSAAIAERIPPLFEIPGVVFSATSLTLPEGLKFDHWERIGRQLQMADMAVQWWIGDWLNYGESHYEDRYAQAIEETGRAKQTLMNYAWVAKAIPTSRRREAVDFTTHAEVASLKPADQEKVLSKAVNDGLSVKAVRREVHHVKRQNGRERSEIEAVHTPEVQEYLKRYIETLKELEESVPLTARFLRNMAQSHAGQANWQKERTVDDDCEIIQQAVRDNGGEMAEDDLYQWLIDHGYFMSDPEFEERLEYMNRDDKRLALLTDAGDDGKQENRRGKLPAIVAVPWRKIWDQGSKRQRDEDDEDT